MYDKSPVEYLRDEHILGPDILVAHCILITDAGIKILGDTHTNICVCPRVYARRGGSTALMRFLEAGCSVGLGTDGQTDMIRNMESAIMGAGFRQNFLGEGNAPSAQKVLELATIEAAKVLGVEDEIGSLEARKKADVIIVDMKRPHMVPNVDPATNLIYYGSGNNVKTVIIDGKVVMEDRTVSTVDEAEMLEGAQQAAENVWTRYYDQMSGRDIIAR